MAVANLRASPAVAEMGPVVSRLGRSAVVVPVSGLERLAAEVARATAHIGQEPDPRPFAGHLTLARLRRRRACGIAGARLSARFEVDRVHLVRSETHPEGARHEVLVTRALTGLT